MRPGQGAGNGSIGGALLGANLGLWTMAGRLSNMNNVPASPNSLAGRLSNLVHASPSMAGRLGHLNNKTNVLSSSSRINITNHLNKNAAQRPHSKVKRLKQENGPRFNDLNTNMRRNKAKALTKPSKNADGTVESVSRESLACHMCNVSDFDSINDYILHLEGVNHTAMSEAYSLKCTANLEIFKVEAKITALRAITKALELENKQDTQTQYCQKCQCTLVGGLAIHEKSSEHLQVINYLGVRCCGTSFNNRLELEEHWLSLQHIQYRSKLLAKFKKQGLTLQKEDENMQKLSALARAEPHFDVSTWPAFDPTLPVGLKYVDTGSSNKCRVCSEYLEPQAVVILSHCCSSKHYQNMCIFYKDLQKNNMQISEVKRETETQNKDQDMAKIDLILNSRANKVKEFPSKVESSPAETEPKDSSTTDDKQKEAIAETSLPPVTTSNTVNEETEDFGTVLETSILSDEAKNESILEEKSDENDLVEDVKEEITEEVQENKNNVETNEILPEDSKDNSNTEQEKVDSEIPSSVELSSSLSSKLAVISEEECDVCENGSGECEKHNASGSPKRKNSGDLKVELGTPKKIRTEEPAVGTPSRRSRRRSVSEEPSTISTPTRTSRRKSISEEPTVSTPTRISGRRKSITQL